MPLMRYFCSVGSVLALLLLVANWYFAEPIGQSTNTGVEDYGIRIRSVAKLPEPVIFDTHQPTIVPPLNTVTVTTQPPQEAFAQIPLTEPSASAPETQTGKPRKTSKRNTSSNASKVASSHPPVRPTRLASAAENVRPVAGMSWIEAIKRRFGQGLFGQN